MDRIRAVVIWSLACSMSLAAGQAHSQLRGQSAMKSPAKIDPAQVQRESMSELERWLPKLVGRFSIMIDGRETTGILDCVAVGTGPGVHCMRSFPDRNGANIRAPTMTLFGVDPDAPGLRYLQVNGDSIAEGAWGGLSGNTVTFRGPCPIPPRQATGSQSPPNIVRCEMTMRIYCPPDGKYVAIQETRELRTYTPGQLRLRAGSTRIEGIANQYLQRMPADWMGDVRQVLKGASPAGSD